MKEPSYTCPTIDKAKDALSSVMDDLLDLQDYYNDLMDEDHRELFGCKIGRMIDDLKMVANERLEEVRTNNCDLRSWGQYHQEHADTFELQADKLNDDLQEARVKIKDLEYEVDELKHETSQKED